MERTGSCWTGEWGARAPERPGGGALGGGRARSPPGPAPPLGGQIPSLAETGSIGGDTASACVTGQVWWVPGRLSGRRTQAPSCVDVSGTVLCKAPTCPLGKARLGRRLSLWRWLRDPAEGQEKSQCGPLKGNRYPGGSGSLGPGRREFGGGGQGLWYVKKRQDQPAAGSGGKKGCSREQAGGTPG